MGLLGGAVRSECWWCSETGKASPVGGGEKKGSDLGRKARRLTAASSCLMWPEGTASQHKAPEKDMDSRSAGQV